MKRNQWIIRPRYKIGQITLKVVLEYESDQVYRFRVHGRKSSLVLQTNIPLLKSLNMKSRPDWKLIDGIMTDATFFMELKYHLERIIKDDDRDPYTHPKNR